MSKLPKKHVKRNLQKDTNSCNEPDFDTFAANLVKRLIPESSTSTKSAETSGTINRTFVHGVTSAKSKKRPKNDKIDATNRSKKLKSRKRNVGRRTLEAEIVRNNEESVSLASDINRVSHHACGGATLQGNESNIGSTNNIFLRVRDCKESFSKIVGKLKLPTLIALSAAEERAKIEHSTVPVPEADEIVIKRKKKEKKKSTKSKPVNGPMLKTTFTKGCCCKHVSASQSNDVGMIFPHVGKLLSRRTSFQQIVANMKLAPTHGNQHGYKSCSCHSETSVESANNQPLPGSETSDHGCDSDAEMTREVDTPDVRREVVDNVSVVKAEVQQPETSTYYNSSSGSSDVEDEQDLKFVKVETESKVLKFLKSEPESECAKPIKVDKNPLEDDLINEVVEPCFVKIENPLVSPIPLMTLDEDASESDREATGLESIASTTTSLPVAASTIEESDKPPKNRRRGRKKKPQCISAKCPYCSKVFTSKNPLESMATHIKNVHTGESLKFSCDICDQKYYSDLHLQNHFRKTQHRKTDLLKCPHCPKTFTSYAGHKYHVKHHSEQPKFECPVCKVKFHELFVLNGHLKNHTRRHVQSRKPKYNYPCSLCEKSFASKRELQEHLNRHNGSRPYVCEYCSKAFASKNERRRHLRVHLGKVGKTEYKCEECQHYFTNGESMKYHILKHANILPFKCVECRSKFRSKASGKRHWRRLHESEGILFENCIIGAVS